MHSTSNPIKRPVVRRLHRCVRWVVLAAALVSACAAGAVGLPYDETADAEADVAAAFAAARRSDRRVLLVFGANWCLGCRLLHGAMQEPELARFIDRHFAVARIDVGNWDRHQELAARWGDPVAEGLPGLVLANARGEILLTVRSSQVGVSRRLDPGAFRQFFEELAALGGERAALGGRAPPRSDVEAR